MCTGTEDNHGMRQPASMVPPVIVQSAMHGAVCHAVQPATVQQHVS